MSKVKKAFFCKECGHESPKWIGKCPGCQQWNTFIEEIIHKESQSQKASWKESSSSDQRSIALHDVIAEDHPRKITKDAELNRVLG